jgi:hypothetical protein
MRHAACYLSSYHMSSPVPSLMRGLLPGLLTSQHFMLFPTLLHAQHCTTMGWPTQLCGLLQRLQHCLVGLQLPGWAVQAGWAA